MISMRWAVGRTLLISCYIHCIWSELWLKSAVTLPSPSALRGFLQRREEHSPSERHSQAKEQLRPVALGSQASVAAGARHQDGLAEAEEEAREAKVLHAVGGRRQGRVQ